VLERVARRRFAVDDDHVGLQAQHAVVDQQRRIEHTHHQMALVHQFRVDQADAVRAVVDEQHAQGRRLGHGSRGVVVRHVSTHDGIGAISVPQTASTPMWAPYGGGEKAFKAGTGLHRPPIEKAPRVHDSRG
jgi:protein-tyrosine-phosphatase